MALDAKSQNSVIHPKIGPVSMGQLKFAVLLPYRRVFVGELGFSEVRLTVPKVNIALALFTTAESHGGSRSHVSSEIANTL
jgi:hypothetical protein